MVDFVIVGAGSAGCVLAARLSEDPKTRVVLLEAGGSDRALRIRAPGLYNLLWRSEYDWELYTEPQQHADGRRMFWPRGKVLGGTSCLNAMIYIRGHRANYDEWRDLGNAGWGYEDVLPYFKRSEGFRGGSSRHHGTNGPLVVSRPDESAPVTRAFVEAAAKHCGVALNDDFNGAEQEGFGVFHQTVDGGVRCSTSAAFLDRATVRSNLQVISGATVLGLVFDGTRVTGVRYVKDGVQSVVHADREVVCCAGAIGSPHLLMLSGIGPAAHLRQHGIPVVMDLPGVGENLQDHLLTAVEYETLERGSPRVTIPDLAWWAARYSVSRRGPLRNTPVEAGGFVRSRPDAAVPDLQFHFVPYGVDRPNTDEKRSPSTGRFFSLLPSLIYPKSRGTIRLRSKDPTATPAIDPNYFGEREDMDLLVRGVHLSREIAASAPLSRFRGKELSPGAEARSDAQIAANVRQRCNTIFHPVGTCKMGVGEDAVVDPQLRVRGVTGLRVVDASIMPRIIGGNTNAPTIMIAEKAADLLRGRAN